MKRYKQRCHCEHCGRRFLQWNEAVERGLARYCSRACLRKSGGDADGPFPNKQGYVTVRVNGRLKLEHRVVMEKHLNRPLRADEVVHHKNRNRADNRVENLEVMGVFEHINLHH